MNPAGSEDRMMANWKERGLRPLASAGISPHKDLSPHELEGSVSVGELLRRIGAGRSVEMSSN